MQADDENDYGLYFRDLFKKNIVLVPLRVAMNVKLYIEYIGLKDTAHKINRVVPKMDL